MGKIYDLNYDYSYQNGQEIIFHERNEEKLTTDDLNAVQLKMIESNQIPHMLPLTMESIDLAAKLHYDITSKRKIVSYFQDNSTTMNDYYQLFLSIIQALESSGSYMLEQNNFILQKEFIFLGENPSDVYLAYLPITKMNKETTLTEDMKNLLTDIAGEVEGLQGNEFKSILNYIKNTSFSLSGLKKLLLELISLRSNVNQPSEMNDGNAVTGGYNPVQSGGYQQMRQPQQQMQTSPTVPDAQSNQYKKAKKQKGKKKLPPLSSRGRIYLILGGVLVIALVWKLYEMNSSSLMLNISSAISFLTIIAVIVFWKVWRPGVKPIITDEADDEEVETPSKVQQTKQKPVQQPMNQQIQQNKPVQQPVHYQTPPLPTQPSEPKIPVQPIADSVPNEQPIRPDFQSFTARNATAATAMDTTLLEGNSDDTVLLEDESNLTMDSHTPKKEITAILIKNSPTGEEETININDTNFLIGRNADSVNYAETAMGVSRIHAEIIRIDATSYGLKDLGAKNGSKLNGNTMVPYKIYALNENDEFELGKANYTFKWSNS